MKRCFDLFLLVLNSPIFIILYCIVFIFVFVTSGRPVIFWSDRVGRDNKIFKMPKFRTMKLDTPQVATHLLDGKNYLIFGGALIRKLSLDEIPQLWSILKGDMSFVGPRPALFNQDDLIKLRSELGVDKLLPGLTGWAQINGRDELTNSEKVKFDREYLKKWSLAIYKKTSLWNNCFAGRKTKFNFYFLNSI